MKKDFRTAYLNTLGFKGGQLKSSLEAIFEHRVIDLGKLKKICNIFEIPSQYRSRVWKILLGVSSSHQETWDFIQEQRTIEYEDLKHAVNLVRRGNLPELFYHQWKEITKQYSMDSDEEIVLKAKEIAANALAIIYHTKEQYFNFQNGLYFINDTMDLNAFQQQQQQNRSLSPSSSMPSASPIMAYPSSEGLPSFDPSKNIPSQLNSLIPNNNNNSNSNNNNNITTNNNNNLNPVNNNNINQNQNQYNLDETNNNNNNNGNDDHVDNVDKLEELVEEYTGSKSNDTFAPQYEESLKLIAEVFCYVCDTEVDAFWCFNNFLNRSAKQYGNKDIGIYHQINILTRLLESYERPLWNHFHQHGIHVDQFSTKWFKSYFTCCFPTLSMDRLWDRIIGVSLDYMAFIAFAIIQSKKSIIFEKQTTNEILNYLLNIKDINIDIILEKSVEYYSNSE